MAELFTPVSPLAWGQHEQVADRVLSRIRDRKLRVAIGTMFASAQALVDDGAIGVVILAARRLVCLYEVLVQEGMRPLDGCVVVSDRYLEANPDLCPAPDLGCHVIILDDSVVVGTTLRNLTERIAALVGTAGSVKSRAVCVDDSQVAHYLFDGLDFLPIHHCNAEQVQEFSTQIVLSLFEQQVPFFADFPVTQAMECSDEAWGRFLESAQWHVADVTGPGLEATGNYAIALTPTSATLEDFLSRFLPEAAALIDAIKLRCYVRTIGAGVRIVAVPIAMVAPATPATLDLALEAIGAHLQDCQDPIDLTWRDWQPEAKHRLLQLFASICVLAEIWPDLGRATDLPDFGPGLLEQLPLELYFGSVSNRIVSAFDAIFRSYKSTKPGHYPLPPQVRIQEPVSASILFDDAVQRMLWGAQEILEGSGIPELPRQGNLTKAGLIFSHAISAVFGFVNNEYELPQRKEIRELGSLDEYRRWFGDGSRRVLSQGFTLRELVQHLLPLKAADGAWGRSLVSLGIDEGNDLGVIVPVTRYDALRDLVFRYYRLGETASLAAWPLVEATIGEQPRTDHFIEAMLAGSPIEPTTVPIADFLALGRPKPVPISREELVRRVRSMVPGRPLTRFNGTVLAVVGNVIEATLLNSTEDDQRDARIPIERIHPDWQAVIRSGSRFTWTTFEAQSPGKIRRTIDIKMRPLPLIDLEQLERNAAGILPDEPGDGSAR